MGIHAERDRFVRVPEGFRDGGHVRAVGYGNGGEAVPELMRVKVCYAIAFAESLKK